MRADIAVARLNGLLKICEQLSTLDPPPKLVWLTSPGNPTGTLIPLDTIRPILDHPTWRGLLVMDEAYIDFSDPEGGNQSTAVQLLEPCPCSQ